MAFANAWVETDPDGNVITVSLLDDSDRLIKGALRERLEGDPAVPNLTGLIEVGSWPNAPKPRKGAARVYVDTAANITAYDATKREDGRLAWASDTNRLYHVATAAVVEANYLPNTGGVITGGLTGTTLILSGDLTAQARVVMSAAVSKLVPGATSFSIRDNADANDNLIITNAGAATIRNGLTVTAGGATITAGGLTVTAGGATITGGIAGTLTTAAQGNITSVGSLATLTVVGDVTAQARIVMTTAVSKVVPGATSLSLRNNADSADNLLIADNGNITVRGTLSGLVNLTLTTLTATNVAGTLTTAAQGNITSVGTLTSLTISGALVVSGTSRFGGGAIITSILTGTLNWTPPVVAAQSVQTNTLTVTGAVVGDVVCVEDHWQNNGLLTTARVSAADTVEICLANITTAGISVGNYTYRVVVIHI